VSTGDDYDNNDGSEATRTGFTMTRLLEHKMARFGIALKESNYLAFRKIAEQNRLPARGTGWAVKFSPSFLPGG
jgi:hypothetical protein